MKGIAGPTAIETAFGWVLSGPGLGLTLEPTVTCLSTVHMIKVDASVCLAQQEIANLDYKHFGTLRHWGLKNARLLSTTTSWKAYHLTIVITVFDFPGNPPVFCSRTTLT